MLSNHINLDRSHNSSFHFRERYTQTKCGKGNTSLKRRSWEL